MRARTGMLWIVLGLTAACIDLGESQKLPKKNPDFLVIGHHGAPNLAAENTVAGLDAAFAAGARGVEIDACVTADGQIVAWHDRDPDDAIALARQQGLEGFLYVPFVPPSGSPYRKPVDQLLLADFLANYGYARNGTSTRDPGAPIMQPADLFAWVHRNAVRVMYLDIKVATGRGDQAVIIYDAVADAVAGDPRLASVIFYLTSPNQDIVQALIAEKARRGVATIRPVWDFETGGALAGTLQLGLRDVSTGVTPLRAESDVLADIDAAVAARNAKQIDTVVVWTIDSPAQLAVMLYHDVDAVITNEPERLYDIWQATL